MAELINADEDAELEEIGSASDEELFIGTVTVGIGIDAFEERVEMSFDAFDDDPDGRLVFRDFLWRRVVTRVDAIISIID